MWLPTVFLIVLVGTQQTLADRVLVLGETSAIKETHSVFLNSVKERGHDLTIRAADDSQLALFKHGQLIFDHLFVLAPGVQVFGGSLSPAEISKFVDAGGNVLVAAGSNIGDALRELAVEHGFEFDEFGTSVVDHFNYDVKLDGGDHTTIVVKDNQLINSELIVGNSAKLNPVLFKGVGLSAGKLNNLALKIVKADGTAYSHDPKASPVKNPSLAGSRTLLVGGLQARNNARIVFSGSVDLFSDAFFAAQVNPSNPIVKAKGVVSGNAEFAASISKWVMKESGVLRVNSVNHHKKGETVPPAEDYFITDDVVYTINIEELKNGKWVPFQGKDVQLEFVRIDPFVRQTMKNINGRQTAAFKIPDVLGVYKFLVDYRRVGYTHVYDVQQVSVRPLWHTQYERFIRSAYPYYASSFSMMFGLVLFSIVYLYHKDTPVKGAKVLESEKKKN
uniref:Dolichyl-diphosphooligosaccharide--protein glycosyltransferase 48 kDa subunit n=1 Tax=Caenorhabditis japonica TaxID=281687 RepID=A0A8R1I2G6_CAEJA